jgi:hypothetical protein
MRLYYFTGLHHALSNLALRRLKISRVSELNDPYELLGADLRDPVLRAGYEAMRDQLGVNRGMICFSRSWHEPVMWSHYADRHRGVCLGFEVADDMIFPISYSDDRVSFTRDMLGVHDAEKHMMRMLGTKHLAWSYEDEVRVFCDLDTEENGLFFHAFDENVALREVILGVRCAVPRGSVERLSAEIASDIVVHGTKLANGRFAVLHPESVE